MACLKFEGSTSFTDNNFTIQGLAGNVKWFNEYEPRGEDRIAKVMLWLCHSMGLCCTIVGEYAMYRAGKLTVLIKVQVFDHMNFQFINGYQPMSRHCIPENKNLQSNSFLVNELPHVLISLYQC